MTLTTKVFTLSRIIVFNNESGIAKAVEIMRRNMQSDSASFISNSAFAFSRLDEIQPAEATRLLSDFISSIKNAPNSYSLSSLFFITHLYLFRKVTPPELQARFLALLIRATRNPTTLSQEDRMYGYNLLKGHLPTIQKLLPSSYPQASAQLAILSSQQTKQTFARKDVAEIIENIPTHSIR